MKKIDLDESQLDGNTSNTTFRLYFLKESVLTDFQSLFERSNCDAFWEKEDEVHEEVCLEEFLFVKL